MQFIDQQLELLIVLLDKIAKRFFLDIEGVWNFKTDPLINDSLLSENSTIVQYLHHLLKNKQEMIGKQFQVSNYTEYMAYYYQRNFMKSFQEYSANADDQGRSRNTVQHLRRSIDEYLHTL